MQEVKDDHPGVPSASPGASTIRCGARFQEHVHGWLGELPGERVG
jgi:hypothetical protein